MDYGKINMNKLAQYIEEEKITVFDSDEECRQWHNNCDFQRFKTVEEMKKYEGIYGFNIGEKHYMINMDEALDIYEVGTETMTRRKAIEIINKRVDDVFTEVRQLCGREDEDISDMDLLELRDIKDGLTCFIMNYLQSDDLENRRTVFFRHGMSNDAMMIITDASRNVIERCCRLERSQELGIRHVIDCLRVAGNHVQVLFDSEVDDVSDLDYLEWNEAYDLQTYRKSRFRIISMKKLSLYPYQMIQATVNLNGKGDIIYCYLGIESLEIDDLRAYGRNMTDAYDVEIYAIDINKLLTPKEVRELYKQMHEAYIDLIGEWK